MSEARALGGFLLADVWTPDLLDQQPSALDEAGGAVFGRVVTP